MARRCGGWVSAAGAERGQRRRRQVRPRGTAESATESPTRAPVARGGRGRGGRGGLQDRNRYTLRCQPNDDARGLRRTARHAGCLHVALPARFTATTTCVHHRGLLDGFRCAAVRCILGSQHMGCHLQQNKIKTRDNAAAPRRRPAWIASAASPALVATRAFARSSSTRTRTILECWHSVGTCTKSSGV